MADDYEYWFGLDLSDPGNDRSAIHSIRSRLAFALEDLLQLQPEVEIPRLREHLETAEQNLRHLEIARAMRDIWPAAFAAGGVADHEEEKGDSTQLNLEGVVDALAAAELNVGHDRERLLATRDMVGLEEQVFGRIIDAEDPPEDDKDREAHNVQRSKAVVEHFADAFLTTTAGAEE